MDTKTNLKTGRVHLDLTMEQAELLREGLMTLADQDLGRRFKILAIHEQVLGALTSARGSETMVSE